MDSIIARIYPSCDVNKHNSVPVSQLIQFIKPYFIENVLELEELRRQLDPNSTNPEITCETFHKTFNLWCNKIKHPTKEQDLENSLSYQIVDKDFSQSQIDIEEIAELKLQLSKITSDFNVVKLQLTSAEEDNELLTSELNKTLQQLHKSNRRIGEMDNYKLENRKLIDELNYLNHQINNLEKQSNDHSTERFQLLDKIKRLENEKLCLQNKLGLLQNQEQEIKKEITEMCNVIEMKNMENKTLAETVEKLKLELEEKKGLLLSSDNQIQSLKHNITYLEELLNERKLINESLETQNLLENIKDSCQHNEDFNLLLISENVQDCAAQVSNSFNTTNAEDNLKEQENIKKNLWRNLQELRSENDLLKHYKNMYFELLEKYDNREEVIEKLKNQNQEFNNKVELYRNNSVALQTSFDEIAKERDDLLERIRILEANNQSQLNNNGRRKINFSRQELIINKLEERIDNLGTDLQLEKDLYKGLLNDYENLLLEKNRNQEEFNKKLDEIKYAHSIAIEELNNKYRKEKDDNQFLNNEVICMVDELNELKTYEESVNSKSKKLLKQSTQLLETIDLKNRIIERLQNNEMNINERLHYFKKKLQEEESDKIELRKQIFDLKSVNGKKLSELELCLHRKEMDLAKTEKELNQLKNQQISLQQNVDPTTQDLDKIISMIQNLNFGIQLESCLNEDSSEANFQSKIKLIAQLIEILTTKHRELLHKIEEIDKAEMVEIPNQIISSGSLDRVLQDLELINDDMGFPLSEQDIEEKFEKLTSVFSTINLEMENGRFEKHQHYCSQLLSKFRKSLNNCVLLLRTNKKTLNTVIAELEQLKNDCCDMFIAAKSFGNLEYEYHVIRHWSLIINYVGTIQRQINNSTTISKSETGCRKERVITNYRKSKFTRKLFSVCVLLGVPVLFCALYNCMFTTEKYLRI